ncbi:ATP-grasp domain-containing protein [Alteribacter aurantiacus]|uniref:ATP-grasp domain-containing protein n=1 Tax=Alteribacter aurantiacus TaxID=254410 RepID=UPI000403CC7F|nr:ATP-grasp domain-containing protein [Alteribacter aurantiacus]
MENTYPITLPNLTNEIVTGARKTKLCAYAVALEGWRRGLKLKWYTVDSGKFDHMITFGVNPPGRLFSLSSGERTHYFFRTRGDKVTNEAVEIGSDKDATKVWLSKAGVPVPRGFMFNEEHEDINIVEEIKSNLNFPLVVKPVDGSLGNGVITNIKNEDELKKALLYVRRDLEYTDVIVERYVPGEEYRVYVVEDKVIAAYNRLPANVIGDGVHTIEELIEEKNKQRKKNARLFSCLIEIDQETLEFIQKGGFTLDSIPNKGEKVLLKEKTNVSAGGDPIDVTDNLPKELKDIAVNAVKAIPGLFHGGVDIIVDIDAPVEKSAVVIELNPTAQIGGILFPVEGKARNIPGAIIDYYFPETQGMRTDSSKVYFDLNTVLEPLQSRSAVEVEVVPAPIGKLYMKRFHVKGTSIQSMSKHRKIKIYALDNQLHGHINSLMDGDIEIVIAGTDRSIVQNFKTIILNVFGSEKIKKIIEDSWKKPVKVGFEINEGLNTSSHKSVETALRKMEKELKKVEKEKNRLEKENLKIQLSRSWNITDPLRKVTSAFRITK